MDQALAKIENAVREHPFIALAATNALTGFAWLWQASEGRPFQYAWKQIFRAALAAVPASVIDKQLDAVRKDIETSVIGDSLEGVPRHRVLPPTGLEKEELITLLNSLADRDETHWRCGKVSGGVYHGGKALSEVIGTALARFDLTNPLHPDLFPAIRQMESEVISMTLNLFNGDAVTTRTGASASPGACGVMTSGGTESILMAIRAYKQLAKATRGVTEPNLVVPVTAHAAFDKACEYFCIKLVHVPVDPVTGQVDLAAMRKAIDGNTIALVASAPTFPHGVIDPIEEISALALAKGLPMHVDCCLGSFVIACAGEAGFPVKPFDFRVPGVTSISADTHKYGYAPKGSSVLMYAHPKYRHAQYFVAPSWTGGIYASPTIAGSRVGACVAGAWAAMLHVGKQGYVDAARKIISAARRIETGIHDKLGKHLTIVGKPHLSVVAFGPVAPGAINIYQVGDAMKRRGWHLNTLQEPACIHICVTFANVDRADEFLVDLTAAVDEVVNAPPGSLKEGSGAIYGLAASIPDKSLVNEVCYAFLDTLFKVDKSS